MLRKANTKVAIVGGGPAGLLLSYVLHTKGIDNIVLEQRSREYVEARIRAGQLDYPTVEYLKQIGIGERLEKEGMPQRGLNLGFEDVFHRIDLEELTCGKYCTIYGQTELTKDLINQLVAVGNSPIFEAEVKKFADTDSDMPSVIYETENEINILQAKFVIGCDGYFGKTRSVIESEHGTGFETLIPYAWYGVFTETPPISHELSYVYSKQGFALCSMRSSKLSRIYLQCHPDSEIEHWSDERFWEELFQRIGGEKASAFVPGPMIDRAVIKMRGYVARALRHNHILLAGDAAHIVPPSAAKGLNLAIADIRQLSEALEDWFIVRSAEKLDNYSTSALERAWAAQEFSHYMTDLLHSACKSSSFIDNLKRARLRDLISSPKQLGQFAERYVGAR